MSLVEVGYVDNSSMGDEQGVITQERCAVFKPSSDGFPNDELKRDKLSISRKPGNLYEHAKRMRRARDLSASPTRLATVPEGDKDVSSSEKLSRFTIRSVTIEKPVGLAKYRIDPVISMTTVGMKTLSSFFK